MKNLWGGRFTEAPLDAVKQFTYSIDVDQALWSQDIRASIAHARMLGKQNVIAAGDAEKIIAALVTIHDELASGALKVDLEAEDIHTFVESKLYGLVGDIAGRLHTARSRNDQVATDTRLFLADATAEIMQQIVALQAVLVALAKKHLADILPGCTHLQHGQPISLAHYLLAFFWMLERDYERLSDALPRVKTLPLGAGALAGTALSIDRKQVAEELGFPRISANSYDAVSDRDFIVEFLSSGALIMTHLSRMAEDLIIWSTPEFSFVEMADSVTTGSSLMPQKKNPDVAELIRGKTARLHADLIGALSLLKALPMSYNRDLQEDKRYLFDGIQTVSGSLNAMQVMLSHTTFKTERMHTALRGDASNATDLADALVCAGVPFREAHGIVGEMVRHAIDAGRAIEDFSKEELLGFHAGFAALEVSSLAHKEVARQKNSEGGTGALAVAKQLADAERVLEGRGTSHGH